jgi:hypothetical protein
MKRVLAILFALMLVSCAAGTAIPTATFNDKAAAGIEAVTAVRQASTALLVAKKITVAQDQAIQAKLDLIRTGIQLAVTLNKSDPQTAAAQLTSELSQLAALKTQTGASP